MAEQKDRFEQARAQVIVVSFDTVERTAALQHRLHLPFVIALDPDRTGYEAFGLGHASLLRTYAHPSVVTFYAKSLLRGRIPSLRHAQDRRQLGGDFVLDRDGVVVLAHPEKGPEDRVAVGSILRAVEDTAANGY